MPDFNKGDFTQQGVAGHVNANLRLNEKRLVSIDLTSNEEAEGCTIAGTVTDLLNDKVYGIGSGVSGNIEITENGENINVAPFATATVNVSGGGLPTMELTLVNNSNTDLYLEEESASNVLQLNYGTFPMIATLEIDAEPTVNVLYNYYPPIFDQPEKYLVRFTYLDSNDAEALTNCLDLVNCTIESTPLSAVSLQITDPSQPSSATVILTTNLQ